MKALFPKNKFKNSLMNKKCILFDADGVVINSELFTVQYQKQFGISNDEMLPFFKGIFQDCLVGKADLKKVVQPYLKKWEWEGDVDGFLLFWFKAEHNIDKRVIELISDLRKNAVLCYLATNQEKYRTEYMRKEMGFDKVFDGIFSSAEIGSKRPDREFYEFIFREVAKKGISKEQIFYIDDTASHVESAEEQGVDAHLYSDFEEFNGFVRPLIKKGFH